MRNKRHEPPEEHADESWLLPYSDLITLLLALFIVLYSVSVVNSSKLEEMGLAFKTAFSSGIGILDKSTILEENNGAKRTEMEYTRKSADKNKDKLAQQEQKNLENLKGQLDKYIQQNGLSSQLDTQLNQSQLLITIRDNALFSPASASIKPEARELAIAISKMLENYQDYEIQVFGHTDTTPINTVEFPSNWELSSKRAINFMKILLENSALDPKKIIASGAGEYRPTDTNDTIEGKAKNRRVEVSILRKYVDAENSQELTVSNEASPQP